MGVCVCWDIHQRTGKDLLPGLACTGLQLQTAAVRFHAGVLPEALLTALMLYVKGEGRAEFHLAGEIQRLKGDALIGPLPVLHVHEA